MKNIIFLVFVGFTLPVFAQRQVDYRYAPQWHVSCIGLPDDTCKTQVGPLGQLLADYAKGKFFNYVGGYRTAVQFLADEGQKFTGQRLYSARVPVVITESTYAGMTVLQEAFAVAKDYIANRTPTREGNREDVILTTVSNTTNRTQTLHPVLIVNADYERKTEVTDRVAVINNSAQVTVSLKPVQVRHNLVDFKTLITLEPVPVAPGETKQMAVLYDNGRPSVLAARFKNDANDLLRSINDIKAEMIAYWETGTDIPYGHLSVPDREIQNLVDASLRGIWQAREIKKEKIAFQVGPTCYRGLWISDGATLLETATLFGRGDAARDGVEYTLSFQKEDGRFEVMEPTYWKENGLVLWTCVRHAMLMQDRAWLKSVWRQLMKTTDFIKELRARTLANDIPLDDGLIPPGQIDGGLHGAADKAEYTNVYWNLAGLKAMIQAAEWLGEKKDARALQAEYDDFFATFQKAAERDMATDLFGNRYLAIPMDPKHRSLPQRAQWAFCQSVYPGQIFSQGDPVATGTMNMLHTTLQEGMVMGTGWAIDGIWTYFAGFYGHACLWMGEGKRACESLYAFANHASPLYAWREEHSPRDLTPSKYVGDMPHNWASALFAGLTVHLLALDRGNELHLLEGVPPEWLQAGMKTSLKEIATPFGKLSFILQVNAQGTEAVLTVDALSDPLCRGVYVHLGDWGTATGASNTSGDASLLKLDAKKQHTLTITLKDGIAN
ncbi:MAG: hypothetical protein LBR08_05485 [Bacteroidales bacterium]|nr:hypothetical protein [Bacteroidales bacterium]